MPVIIFRQSFGVVFLATGINILLILAGVRFMYTKLSVLNYNQDRTSERDDTGNVIEIMNANYHNISNTEKILDNTRSKINYELNKYNYSESGVQDLEDLLMEHGGRPIRSLLISSWRTGSTFFGQLLSATAGTFYHVEPLLKYGIVQIRRPPLSYRAVNELRNMFKCDFRNMDDYFDFARTDLLQFRENKRLWEHCEHNRDLCYDPDFTARYCKLFPFQTMKVCRLRLRFVQAILDDNDLNVKVILLIRDPRGVMNSRRHRSFCENNLDCWQPELLCADMIRDYRAASQLLTQYPDRFMVVRFEDLAMNTEAIAHRVLKFLKISATQKIEEFLQKHTKYEEPGFSSTYRVSRNIPFKWKNQMEFNDVDEIQMVCTEAMSLWGYQRTHNATHMASKDFVPVENYTIIK